MYLLTPLPCEFRVSASEVSSEVELWAHCGLGDSSLPVLPSGLIQFSRLSAREDAGRGSLLIMMVI